MIKTRREAFDVVKAHLLAQGEQCIGLDGGCAYRGPNGTKCAIGILIADEHYDNELEGTNVQTPAVSEAISDSGWPLDSISLNLYEVLQDVHDNVNVDVNISKVWKSELIAIEMEYFE